MAVRELNPNANGGHSFSSRFFRAKGKIYTSEPNDLDTEHLTLINALGLFDEVKALVAKNPTYFDAGLVNFTPPDTLQFFSVSLALKWPNKNNIKAVRGETVETAKHLFPEYDISAT